LARQNKRINVALQPVATFTEPAVSNRKMKL
jgi:hypothetical protein